MTATKTSNRIDTLLKSIGQIADETGVPVYAVGGAVRDRLLGKPVEEIDFVAIGDGIAFAETAKARLGGTGFVVFERFGTASFVLDPFKLEFVGARRESYDVHSRKPSVESAGLL